MPSLFHFFLLLDLADARIKINRIKIKIEIKKKGPESLWIRGPWLLYLEIYPIELQAPNPSAVFLVAK
ncbi:MAG: hypothetical protein EB019_01950 [Actinobacteria bacterium]|nr:hypothetical protein [Actinomycetota bacterium]